MTEHSSEQVHIYELDINELQNHILAWFDRYRRDFPWRRTTDPYAILIAEKLLQQTAARQGVVEAFEAIMTQYPTPSLLAEANIEELQQIIAPLGFHYRAMELKTLARAIVQRHGGVVPFDLKELKALPGVGDYAARAVLSFAHGEDVPVVDTNVARFLYRVFGIEDRFPSNPARKKSLIDLAARLVPAGRGREFNLAILDLCALVCLPSVPRCETCPIHSLCKLGQAREDNNSITSGCNAQSEGTCNTT